MDLKILIVTPDRSFGGQITETLREANYYPILATSTAEATFIIEDEKCPIAILDCNLPDPGLNYLATELRLRFDDLRIIFIHTEDESTKPTKLNPARDINLPHPFFIPDLLEVIHLWVAEKKDSVNVTQQPYKSQEIPKKLAWLLDVNKAAQYLTRLSLEVDSQVALITRGTRIWAYAGQMSKSAIEELAQFVGHHWENGGGSDLARFVRLETTGGEYMLYATHLGSGFVLALSFKTEMPFSKMRAQTGELARKLTSPLLEPPTANKLAIEQDGMNGSINEKKSGEGQWILESEDVPERHVDGEGYANVKYMGRLQDVDPHTKTDVKLVPGSYAQHDLAYSCVLLPRLPDHQLTGILTGLLSVEMSRLCLVFGWCLEHLDIRTEYLHWVVGVNPDVSASMVIDHIREQTSLLLFNEFPRLAKENPSGDFWAPGFLVINGRKPLAGSLVQVFIQDTRARQGIVQTIKSENNA